jgi:methylase of polypeptide subunit release factors
MRFGPLHIERPLPGEFEGTLDPRDYGFEVIPVEQTNEELQQGAAELYRQARMNFGVQHPRLDALLAIQPYNPEPAEILLARHEALEYPYACEFGQAELTIDRGVFCPTLTEVSPFLLEHTVFKPGQRVLDAFTGSGAFAVNAALMGCEVVGFDKSEEAVACARRNAEQNGVADKVDIRTGTLAETMTAEDTFDLIIANPPPIPGNPEGPLAGALFDKELKATSEFIAALPGLLAKHGRCLLLTSDVIDRASHKVDIAQACHDNKLAMEITAQLHYPYESYRIHTIERETLSTRLRPVAQRAIRSFLAH